MRRFLNFLGITFIIWTTLILLLIFQGKVTFGHGLGDLFYVMFLVIVAFLYIIIIYKNLKKKINPLLIYSIAPIIIIILFTLKMTIYRGIEYPWNGKIFFN